jgi:superfamily I DNA/RNA helicase
MNYSQYQIDIFKEIERLDGGHLAINAVAGSGKTFTALKSVERIPTAYSVRLCAFGKDIQTTLEERCDRKNTEIQTYNAFGWGILRKTGRFKLDKLKTDKTLRYHVLKPDENNKEEMKKFYRVKHPIQRLVSLLKGQCCFDKESAAAALPGLIEHYAIEIPKGEMNFHEMVIDVFDKSINHNYFMDFDDQIYQVLRRDLLIPAYDYVIVDEFQDTNEMQFRMMQQASANGRFIGIGDPDQAIFGFRGSTPGQFQRFVAAFQAKEMPLSVCYRCPKLIIQEAKKIVPRIEAAPDAIEGDIGTVSTDDFLRSVKLGDFILCRTVAPLVKRCLQFIKRGIPARVLGRDIGEDLEYLVDKISGHDEMMYCGTFSNLMEEYYQKRAEDTTFPNALLVLEDKITTIMFIMEDCTYVKDLIKKIQMVFSDDVEECLKFMSIHKSKGLECDNNVWLLRPDLLPHPRARVMEWMMAEEERLKYVAITRTKKGLYFVTKEHGEK